MSNTIRKNFREAAVWMHSQLTSGAAAVVIVSKCLASWLLVIITDISQQRQIQAEYRQSYVCVTVQLVHHQPPDLPRLSAAQRCCSRLCFAAEALVLLRGRQNNMERCCRLKCSGSSPQSKMPSCWLGLSGSHSSGWGLEGNHQNTMQLAQR